MNSIQYDNNTRPVHKHFIDWANGMLTAYEPGIWDDAIKNVLAATFIQKITVFIQEMYSLDGKNLLGYLMVTDTDNVYRALFFDYATGVPTYYCNSGLDNLFSISDGVITEFFTNTQVDFQGDTPGVLLLSHEYFFGIKMPVMTLLTNGGDFVARGAMDIIYENRQSGTYSVTLVPVDVITTIEIKSKSKTSLTFQLPILDGFSVQYVIKPGQVLVVPRTALSEYFITTSFDQGSMEYRFL